MSLFTPPTFEIDLTTHCVERFNQRVRPTLDHECARRELRRLLDIGRVRTEAPAWLATRTRQASDRYLVIEPDLVLPLVWNGFSQTWVARTCLARTGISENARWGRNLKARKRRAARRGRQGR